MISLIFCGDLKYCPYIQRYIERLDAVNAEYEVVFWNRSGEELSLPSNYKYFKDSSELKKRKLNKIFDFFKFRRYLLNYLSKTKCNKFVLLSTLSGVLVGSELIKRKAKYIFDIRDYSYEWLYPYYIMEKNVIEHSFRTVISSPGFKKFLPDDKDYIIAHNFNRKDIKKINNDRYDDVVKIVWLGVIRFFDYQCKIISALANDDRFELLYHGDGPDLDRLKVFCHDRCIKNVMFTGSYDNRYKDNLLFEADLLNNCYGYLGGGGNKLKYAISNKFYDGLIYRIPQIVEKDGYKSDLVKQYRLGMALDIDGDIANQIISFRKQFDESSFDKNCEILLDKTKKEDDLYIKSIDEFIHSN